MEQIILSENTSEDQKMHLHFALGKAYEDIKLYDEAFDCWKKGNIIIRKKINYSTQKQENFFENLKNIFSEKLFKQFKNTKKNKEKIIFIIGMPRSGTTLVQQILSSHPDVVGLGESILFTKMVQNNFYERKGDLVQDISKLNKETLVKIGEDFLKKIEQIIYSADNLINKKHILIKDPLNFRWMGFIKLIFPNAKVINCTRNPFDNCVSLYKTFFIGGVDFSYNLSELGLYYNFYLDLMNFWEEKIPEFFENISYENIINNREHETRKLLNYCNLQWHENCMQSHKYVHSMSTGTNSIKIHKPMYKSSIQYWKHYENHLKPLMEIIKT